MKGFDDLPPGERTLDKIKRVPWVPPDEAEPSGPTSGAEALALLVDLAARAEAKEAKGAEARALLRDATLLAALASCDPDEVAASLDHLRDSRGFAAVSDELRTAIRVTRAACKDGATPRHDAVLSALDYGASGEPVRSLANAERALRLDPHWRGRIRWNEHAQGAELDGKAIEDHDNGRIRIWLDVAYGIRVSQADTVMAVELVAQADPYHPICDWLDGLEWDGVARADGWLVDYCGSPDRRIVRAYARRWLISAVARVYRPGCKVDTTLILQGDQGLGKSRALRLLAGGDWFADTVIDLRNKDAMLALRRVWLYEMAELDQVARSEVTAVKAFLSSQVDYYRPPYGRAVSAYPRQCVIVGSSNEDTFLRDSTGSRRFWPVQTGANGKPIDLDGLASVRDQLWAEAVALFRADEPWWLTPAEEERRIESAPLFSEVDAWQDPILAWLASRGGGPVAIATVWTEALGKRLGDLRQGHSMRIARILRGDGWVRRHTRSGKVWEPGP